MITRQLLKDEIENVPTEYLAVLFKIIRALEESGGEPRLADVHQLPTTGNGSWQDFVTETYGCLADVPIKRSDDLRYHACIL